MIAKPAVTLVLLIVFAAACDDSSDHRDGTRRPPPSAPKVLTHRQLVIRMDALCREANEKLGNAGQKVTAYGAAHRHRLVVDAHQEFAEVNAQFVRDVEAIKPPHKDRHGFDLYLRGAKRQAVLSKREAKLARRAEHPEAPEVISRYDDAHERAWKARRKGGRDLGTYVCGR